MTGASLLQASADALHAAIATAESRPQVMTHLTLDEAISKLHAQLNVGGDGSDGPLIIQFNTNFKEGKYPEAERAALQAHELDPDNPLANMATGFLAAGDRAAR